MDGSCCLCLVFVMILRLFIVGLWSPDLLALVCDVYCDFATCLKIVPNNSIVFVFTPLLQVICNLKEQPDIYPKKSIPSLH